jgi:hypothetical protein
VFEAVDEPTFFDHLRWYFLQLLVSLFLGTLVGLWMARREPLLVSSGRFIWIAPALVILYDICLRARYQPGGIPWLSDYLFASTGDEGLGVFLLLEK